MVVDSLEEMMETGHLGKDRFVHAFVETKAPFALFGPLSYLMMDGELAFPKSIQLLLLKTAFACS